ncbi:MAG: hypothetical protein INR71_01955, partial [Terriglobus roseus]|nr:hypothetical protein [Terriglobus roseus]
MGRRTQLGADPAKEPNFLFVNSTATSKQQNDDKQTRTSIRRHIMRDIGRARRKRPR